MNLRCPGECKPVFVDFEEGACWVWGPQEVTQREVGLQVRGWPREVAAVGGGFVDILGPGSHEVPLFKFGVGLQV